VAAKVSQRIELWLPTVDPGKYGTPEVSIPAVRFVDARFGGGPPIPPAGPPQLFRFVADGPGNASIHIPYSDESADYQATIEVSPR